MHETFTREGEIIMKNVSFIFAIFLIAFSAFGCDGDSSQDNPIETKAYGIVSGTDGLLVCTSTNGTTWSQMDVPGDLSEADFGGVAHRHKYIAISMLV